MSNKNKDEVLKVTGDAALGVGAAALAGEAGYTGVKALSGMRYEAGQLATLQNDANIEAGHTGAILPTYIYKDTLNQQLNAAGITDKSAIAGIDAAGQKLALDVYNGANQKIIQQDELLLHNKIDAAYHAAHPGYENIVHAGITSASEALHTVPGMIAAIAAAAMTAIGGTLAVLTRRGREK